MAGGPAPAAGAEPAAVIPVWPEGKMPGNAAREPEKRHAPERTDALRITQISRPTLTLFPAPDAAAPAPLVIVCPGGGYGYVVFDKEGTEIAAWLNRNGISAAVLKYRTPNNRDGALMDLQRAVSVARGRAAEWKVDPKRIGSIGFSAGGHLAAQSAMRGNDRAYAAIDAIDQTPCRPDFAMLVYPAYLAGKDGAVASDVRIGPDLSPLLIVHNDDDKAFIGGSRALHAALEKAGIRHGFLCYASGGHGYGLRSEKDARAWPDDALRWMKEAGLR